MRFTRILPAIKMHYAHCLFKEKQYKCDKRVGLIAL